MLPRLPYRGASDSDDNDGAVENAISIRGHVDLDQGVVYLHLVSVRDAAFLAQLCSTFLAKSTSGAQGRDADEKSDAANDSSSFHSFMAEAELAAARALLFIFSVSHLIVVSNPGSRFDINLVRLFRNLDAIRVKLQGSVCDVLKPIPGVGKEWMYAGRPCSPRLLFVFEKNPLARFRDNANGAADATTPAAPPGFASNAPQANPDDFDRVPRRGVSTDAIKRLQHSMEDQIYRILRKARIITNISNNSLFAVPANDEFVYVMRHHENDGEAFDQLLTGSNPVDETLDDPMAFMMKKLDALCVLGGGDAASSQASKSSLSLSSAGSSSHPSWSTSGSSAATSASVSSMNPNAPTASQSKSSHRPTSFTDFVQRHIEQALNKGKLLNGGATSYPDVF